MRKIVIIISLITTLTPLVGAQQSDNYFIDMSVYQNVVGVVFEGSYPDVGFIEGLNDRFTPQIMDLINAEEAIHNICSKAEESHFICYEIDDFKHYKRQYVGRINTKGEKVLEIQFLNFKKREAEENFKGWEEDILIASGTFYEKNTFPVLINLSTGKIK